MLKRLAMKLYFSPGACSLVPHIVLRELGLNALLVRVDLRTKQAKDGSNFLAINSKGYVPALQLDDGTVLTEAAIMVQYLADKHPESKLAPTIGTPERYHLQELLHFVATELHKGASPIYNPKANDEFKQSLMDRLKLRLGVLENELGNKTFLMGEQYTVVDPYAYYTLRNWQRLSKTDLSDFPGLKRYYVRLEACPVIQAAIEAETKVA